MSKKNAFVLWGVLFALCAGLGFLQPVEGFVRYLLLALSVFFFLPPAWLLRQDEDSRKLVRNLSALSLGLTLILLVLNFLTALQSEIVGGVLYSILTIVSSPMVCSGYWVVSLFLWACLLMGSLKKRHHSG